MQSYVVRLRAGEGGPLLFSDQDSPAVDLVRQGVSELWARGIAAVRDQEQRATARAPAA